MNIGRWRRVALAISFSVALSGCPNQGVVCTEGLSPCGRSCADLSADRYNCGACGALCQSGEVCQAGACKCQPGAATCDGTCAVLATDARHCGVCGNSCGASQVCEG